MIRFLNKETELHLLEQLFDLLYENMAEIAPPGLPYEAEKQQFLSNVRPAMEKAPRQIVLMYDEDALAGYLQYYVNNGIFMVEEIQIRKGFRSTSLFAQLWKFMAEMIPADTQYIEAYADKRNLPSRRLIAKLGMNAVGETPDGACLHFRGAFRSMPILSRQRKFLL